MDSLGENLERSNLYLKLFKLVFGSVTLFAQENELMLKVCVHVFVGHCLANQKFYISILLLATRGVWVIIG